MRDRGVALWPWRWGEPSRDGGASGWLALLGGSKTGRRGTGVVTAAEQALAALLVVVAAGA